MSRLPAARKLIPLPGERALVASYTLAKRKSRKWVVFLPESGSDFRDGDRELLASLAGAAGRRANFLVINKPGVFDGHEDRAMFEESFRREKRIADNLLALRAIVPKGDVIHLVGYSEGAYLAPQIALLDKRVRTVCMIGGGTRGWLKEELANATKAERPRFQREIARILKTPRADLKWGGFSHATWHSYRGDHTLAALRKSKLPTLAIMGARDRVIDLKTAISDLVLISEKKPIQLHVFGDCGHYFTRHWKQVSRVLARFLKDHA